MHSILFRCHASDVYGLAVTLANLVTLAAQNLGVPIHVLHGGRTSRSEKLFGQAVRRLFASYARSPEGMPLTSQKRPFWWAHPDLAIVDWYKREGYRHQLGQLFVCDWDMVLGEPVAQLCSRIPQEAVGLTWLKSFEEMSAINWDWLTAPALRPEALYLVEWASRTYGYQGPYYGCWFTGSVLPEYFLRRYSEQADLPAVSCVEVRLPLVARAIGFSLADTGLLRDDPILDKYMNVDEMAWSVVLANPRLLADCRLFHPVTTLGAALLLQILLVPRSRRAQAALRTALGAH